MIEVSDDTGRAVSYVSDYVKRYKFTPEEIDTIFDWGFLSAIHFDGPIKEKYELVHQDKDEINELFRVMLRNKNVVDCEECTNCLAQRPA